MNVLNGIYNGLDGIYECPWWHLWMSLMASITKLLSYLMLASWKDGLKAIHIVTIAPLNVEFMQEVTFEVIEILVTTAPLDADLRSSKKGLEAIQRDYRTTRCSVYVEGYIWGHREIDPHRRRQFSPQPGSRGGCRMPCYHGTLENIGKLNHVVHLPECEYFIKHKWSNITKLY